MLIILVILVVIYGAGSFLGAAFWWDKFSQHPEWFPGAKKHKWQVDTYGWLEDDGAVRKKVMVYSAVIVILGILIASGLMKDSTEWGQIVDFPKIWEGDTVSFAGGELALEDVGFPDGFTATRFNLDKNTYEEVEVKADMSRGILLLVKTTLTNNGSGTLSVMHEDLKFYAKPEEEGRNIKGYAAVDGYLYHDNPIELAAGESVPIWFWMSFTDEEELHQRYAYVMQYGSTGCLLAPPY